MKHAWDKFWKFGHVGNAIRKAGAAFLLLATLATASFGYMHTLVSGYSVSVSAFKTFSNGFEASLRVTDGGSPVEDVLVTCEIYENDRGGVVDIETELTDPDGDALFEIGGLKSDVDYMAYFKIGSTVYSSRSFRTDSSLEENPNSGCNGGLIGMAGFALMAMAVAFCGKKRPTRP